jgi:hypothetical protein
MKPLLLVCATAGVLFAQQLKIDLDHLAKKASNTVDVSLPPNLIQLGAAMLDPKDPEQAQAKKIVSGLQAIYIRSYEFQKEGEYTKADLDQIRVQLKAPEWQRMVGVVSSEDRETVEVWVRTEGAKMSGLAILAADPRELTVVNLVGAVDLNSLAELGGHLGIPKINVVPKQQNKKK